MRSPPSGAAAFAFGALGDGAVGMRAGEVEVPGGRVLRSRSALLESRMRRPGSSPRLPHVLSQRVALPPRSPIFRSFSDSWHGNAVWGSVDHATAPPCSLGAASRPLRPSGFLSGDESWRLRRGIPRAADALPMHRKPLYPTLCPPVARSTLPQTVKLCQEAEHERNRASRHEKRCWRAGWPSPRVRGLIVCVPLRGFAVELGRVARLRPVARMNRFHLYLR